MTPNQFNEARKRLNMTQEQLAEVLEVSLSTIARLESVAVDKRTALAIHYLLLCDQF